MHLHLHINHDFGPHSFSFQRFNGLLGSYSTNKKAIEVQVMRKFCTAQNAYALIPYIDSDLKDILPVSLSAFGVDDSTTISLLNICYTPLCSIPSFENSGIVTLLPPLREEVFRFDDCCRLQKIYAQLVIISHMSHSYISCKQVALGGDIIGSIKCGSASSVIMAYWPGQGDNLSNISYTSRKSVQHYIKHTVSMKYPTETVPRNYDHVLACVSWKQRHPSEDSATVCFDMFEASNTACIFIPVQTIYCRCAYANFPIEIGPITETLFVACPLPVKYCL